jgi:hypothetical protein
MRKIYSALAVVLTLALIILTITYNGKKELHPQIDNDVYPVKSSFENDQEDDMDKAMEFEIEKTKDIKLGYVPTQRLLLAREQQKQKIAKQNNIALRLLLFQASHGQKEDLPISAEEQELSGLI